VVSRKGRCGVCRIARSRKCGDLRVGDRNYLPPRVLSADFRSDAVTDKDGRAPVNCCFDWTASTLCSIIFVAPHPLQVAGLSRLLYLEFFYSSRGFFIVAPGAPIRLRGVARFLSRRVFFSRVVIRSPLWGAKRDKLREELR